MCANSDFENITNVCLCSKHVSQITNIPENENNKSIREFEIK